MSNVINLAECHRLDQTRTDGIAYAGKRPWHGLGTRLDAGESLDQWRVAAGLDWRVQRGLVLFDAYDEGTGTSQARVVPDRTVLYRSDNHEALSVVSNRYQIVQPEEVLEFFSDLVEAGGFELETAGGLNGGRNIWALARVGDDLVLPGRDRVEGFLLLATSCDGSMATTAKFTTVRVVCQNTLHMADSDGRQPSVSVPHSTTFDPEAVKCDLGLRGRAAWAEFSALAEELAGRRVTRGEAQRWLIETFGAPGKPLEEQDEAAAKRMQKVWASVTDGPGAGTASADGTAWGLLQGATHYLDYGRAYRSDNNRLNAAWFGDGAAAKHRAFGNALRLVA